MTRAEFDAVVQRLESEAQQRPRAYQFRTFALALLGYAYIFLVVGLLSLLIGSLVRAVIASRRGGVAQVAWTLGLPLVGLTVVILRSLWIRLHPPAGIALSPKQAWPLFHLVDHTRRALKSPPVHSILLNDEFNASVTQIPRLGLFGWQRNYLTVGLPLMHALSPTSFAPSWPTSWDTSAAPTAASPVGFAGSGRAGAGSPRRSRKSTTSRTRPATGAIHRNALGAARRPRSPARPALPRPGAVHKDHE